MAELDIQFAKQLTLGIRQALEDKDLFLTGTLVINDSDGNIMVTRHLESPNKSELTIEYNGQVIERYRN